MKSVLILIMGIFFAQISAQSNVSLVTQTSNTGVSFNNNAYQFGAYTTFKNPYRGIEGSVYLFKGWNNRVVIHTADNNKFFMRKVNLNLIRNTIEVKTSEDSLFIFNFNNINKFAINNRVFKNFYYNDNNRVYEMIYESDELSLLKGFTIRLIEASPNPMNNRPKDRYLQGHIYFIKRGDDIKKFALKKSKILRLIDDPEKVAKLKDYALRNELSFKKEYDVRKILEYYNTLKKI